MAFKYKGSLLGNTGPALVTYIIANSAVISVGEAVNSDTGGYAVGASTTAALAGIVHDIVDVNGNSVFGSLRVLGSATVTGSPSSGTVTVAPNNVTVDKIAVKVDISPFSVYSASVTGTIGTTATSNLPGAYVTLTGNDIDETSATRTIGTSGKLFVTVPSPTPSLGALDPDDTTRVLVKMRSCEYFQDGGTMA